MGPMRTNSLLNPNGATVSRFPCSAAHRAAIRIIHPLTRNTFASHSPRSLHHGMEVGRKTGSLENSIEIYVVLNLTTFEFDVILEVAFSEENGRTLPGYPRCPNTNW